LEHEADCGADWDADQNSAAQDQFVLRVDDDGEFGSGDVPLPPNPTASANVLGLGSIAGSGTRSLDFQLVMPTAITGTNQSCTIPVTFTASAA
jgi:hypothetical protein